MKLNYLSIILFYSLFTIASALELKNDFLKVSISQPANTSNLVGIKKGNDFYFFAKPDWPTKEFDVKYTVSLVKSKCVLKTPASPTGTTKTKGGLITPYLVEYQVPGEKKIKGEIYFIPVRIKEVSFSGNNYSELRHYTSSPIYNAPHWRDNNEDGDVGDNPHTKEEDRQFSVAYVANQRAEISADFVAVGLPADAGIKIAVTLDDTNGIADIEQASVNQAGGIITLPATKTKHPFAKTVAFYDRFNNKPFKGTWKVHFDKVSLEAGLTEHQIYVTLRAPNTTQTRETMFYHTCKAAEGAANDIEVVAGVWREFTDREVSRYHILTGDADVDDVNSLGEKGMIYWNPAAPVCRSVTNLLIAGDASCGIWSDYLITCLKAHDVTLRPNPPAAPGAGNQVSKILIEAQIPDIASIGRLVNEYRTFSGFTGNIYYVSQNPLIGDNIPASANAGDRILYIEGLFFVNKTNIPPASRFINVPPNFSGFAGGASVSQGNSNAKAWFRNHAIVKYGTNYYDPSYGGAVHTSYRAWEGASLESHGAFVSLVVINPVAGGPRFSLSGVEHLWKGDDDVAADTETRESSIPIITP